MKNTLFISLILITLSSISVAHSQRVESKMQHNIVENNDYLFMENNKLLYIIGGTGMGTKTQHDMTFRNGTIIKPDGSYIIQSGALLHLKNGQIMDMNGFMYKSERKFFKKTHRIKVEKTASHNMHSDGHQQYSNGNSSHHH